MRHASLTQLIVLYFAAIALSACGKSEEKVGSLTQHYTMHDTNGVNFGTVELDPINGGTILDAQGRAFARVIPYTLNTASNQ